MANITIKKGEKKPCFVCNKYFPYCECTLKQMIKTYCDCEKTHKDMKELENAAKEFCLLIRLHNQAIKKVLSPNDAMTFLKSFARLESLL